MFMQRIEMPAEPVAQQLVPAATSRLSRAVLVAFAGFLFIAIVTPVTIIYWVVVAVWISVWAVVRGVAATMRSVWDTVNFAGRAIVSG